MFVKKNRNRSGCISVQVLAKIGRSNRLIKTFGTSSDEREISRLCEVACQWANEHGIKIPRGTHIYKLDTP